MGYPRIGADKLSLPDLDALVKSCQLSLRILDKPLEDASLSVEDIARNAPPRRFLYQGEHVQAFVVAVIPNTDQIRRSLATEMRRKDNPKLAKGELAVDADEIEQFFTRVHLCVTAYLAKTTTTAVDSSHAPRKASGRIAPTRRISNVSCSAAFTKSIRPDQQHTSLIRKLDDGSWCCAYKLAINTPSPQGYQDSSFENAILFEVRAASEEPGASLQESNSNCSDKVAEYRGGLSDRSSHLEELSIRVSSWMPNNNNKAHDPGQFEQPARRNRRNSLESTGTLSQSRPYQMIQALVPTRPILNTSARVVSLPLSFGTDAALVEVCVQSDSAALRAVSLEAVEFETSHWHIQPIGSHQSSLPFALSAQSCYQMVFRASPLTDPVKPDAFHGLNLLNIGGLHIDTGTKGTSLPSVTLNNESASVSAEKRAERLLNIRFSATVKDDNGENSGDSFEVVHRVFPHQTHDRNQKHVYEHVLATGTAGSAGRASNASETLHSTSPRSAYSQNMRYTADNNRGAIIGSGDTGARVSGGYSHLKTASLDHNLLQSQRPPGRKYSLALPPKPSLTQADGRSTQMLQGKQRAAGQSRMNPRQDRKLSNKQRSRAATINAFGALPPLPSQKPSLPSSTKTAMSGSRSSTLQSHRPQSSVSTIHSVSSSAAASGPLNYPHLLSSEPSLGAERISLRRRPSAGSVLATESLRNIVRPRATVGTIELSFEAPPKVGLGKELAVNAYVSNNTNTHYFRLCLVDGNGTDAAGDVAFEQSSSTGTQGLIPMNHVTSVPPLRPGESTFVTLQYIAAAPYFHAVDMLRLVNLDADTADKTVTSIDSPFIVFVDDCDK